MLALEEVWKGREVRALEKDMEESPLPWRCIDVQQDQSTDGQDQPNGDMIS